MAECRGSGGEPSGGGPVGQVGEHCVHGGGELVEIGHDAGAERGYALCGGWSRPRRRRSRTDAFLRVVVEGWQVMVKALDSVTEMVIKGIFPWCFTPELYAPRPDHVDSLAEFVRGRPMPPVDAFLRQSEAVLAYDASGQLARVQVPTLVSFGRRDMVTSTRFAEPLTLGIPHSELVVFEGCAHPLSTSASRSSTPAPSPSCSSTRDNT